VKVSTRRFQSLYPLFPNRQVFRNIFPTGIRALAGPKRLKSAAAPAKAQKKHASVAHTTLNAFSRITLHIRKGRFDWIAIQCGSENTGTIPEKIDPDIFDLPKFSDAA
jgi:hypothetical protein